MGVFLLFACHGMDAAAMAVEPAATADAIDQQEAGKFVAWLKNNRAPDLGVPYSHVGDPRFEHWSITYDAAIAALAYLAVDEVPAARKILDTYIDTAQLWRLGGVVEAFMAGHPLRVVDWSVRSGANIWLANASLRCYQKTGEDRYLVLSRRIMDLMLRLQQQRPDHPNSGGVALGPAGDPQYPTDQHIGYDPGMPHFKDIYATEINIDAYTMFRLLARSTGEVKYTQAAQGCLKWLSHNAWNREEHRFDRGFRDKAVATDVQSWGISALGVEGLDSLEPGLAEKIAYFIESRCLSSVSYDKPGVGRVPVKGVDFVDKGRLAELGRGPLVSFEWTFQLANAYLRLEHDLARQGKTEKALAYRRKRAELLSQLVAAASPSDGGLAFPYATEAEALIGHEYRTPLSGNFSAIGAAYAVLALRGYDPLDIDEPVWENISSGGRAYADK